MDKNRFFIHPGMPIKSALKKLDETAEKVLIVVDSDHKMLGTLSDGDVRRYILKGGSLDGEIDRIYNKKATSISKSNLHPEVVKKYLLVDKLGVVPVTDNEGVVIDCITTKAFFEGEVKIAPNHLIDIPVVIMAGGKGVRMEPFTSILPKPLLPIGTKTIIETIIDEFKFYGLKNFNLTLNYKAEMIEAYFASLEKDYSVSFFKEKDFFGTAGSLLFFKDFPDETFLVSNCDIIVKADYSELLDFHIKNKADLTVVSSIQHYKIPYGVVDFSKGGSVVKMIEKPEYTFTINTGVYFVNKSCLEYIKKDEKLDMTSLIDRLLLEGKKVLTYPVNESDYIDIGQWDEYKKAVTKLSLY